MKMEIKKGDTIRVKVVNAPAPDWYLEFVGKEFIVENDPSESGVVVGSGFFYFDEIELVKSAKSLFEFGPYNEDMKDRFLAYLSDIQFFGICSATNNYVFVQSEIDKTGYDKLYPIEHAISKKNHKKRTPSQLKNLYESQRERDANYLIITGMNSPKTPYGKLRRWWAYNLAVAISQQHLGATSIITEPVPIVEEPKFDSNIILTAPIGSKIVLDGVEFTLKSMDNGKVFLDSPPVDGYETFSPSYPHLHVRGISTRFASFSRQKLKDLIDNKQYKIG